MPEQQNQSQQSQQSPSAVSVNDPYAGNILETQVKLQIAAQVLEANKPK